MQLCPVEHKALPERTRVGQAAAGPTGIFTKRGLRIEDMRLQPQASANKKDLPPVLPAPTIADMKTPPELREQLRESREENRGFWAGLDLITEIITCQDEGEEDEDEDPKEDGDEKEEEEGEEDSEEGEVDKYYLGRQARAYVDHRDDLVVLLQRRKGHWHLPNE